MAIQIPLQFEFKGDKTFPDFYIGSNQEIVEQLQNCASGAGEHLLYIWGGQGQGKTHLLQACCHQAQQHNKLAFYIPLNKQLPAPSILEGLENFDIVCVDNIEIIASKPAWEQAFFTFFNQIYNLKNRLILSSSCPPDKLEIHLPDLKTRLNWGLSMRLLPLNEKDKIAALSFRAHLKGFCISPQVSSFLVRRYSRDLPSLWALLDKIDQETLAAKRKLTVPFLKQIIESEIQN
jgi:DnaA-homolog protein